MGMRRAVILKSSFLYKLFYILTQNTFTNRKIKSVHFVSNLLKSVPY